MKLKDSILISDLDGSYIMIDSIISDDRFNGMIKLNETSKDIVECFLEDRSIDEVVEIIFNKYEKDKDNIRKDVIKIVDDLKSVGYLND